MTKKSTKTIDGKRSVVYLVQPIANSQQNI